MKKYFNITRNHCELYVKLCYVCNAENPKIAPLKGAVKPIHSGQFRDRFQVDLIDMNNNAQANPYGVVMRWIMTVKDHSTGFIMLAALPNKKAEYVAFELSNMFGHIGFPHIFHTDNGKEFTAKIIIEFLKDTNPKITSVTGCPRKPSDQGSVENANKQVQKALGKLERHERNEGKVFNWTRQLGRVAMMLNSATQKSSGTSAYETVFGMDYGGSEQCDHATLRKCETLEERMRLIASPRFDAVARELYYLDDELEGEIDEDTAPKKLEYDDNMMDDDEMKKQPAVDCPRPRPSLVSDVGSTDVDVGSTDVDEEVQVVDEVNSKTITRMKHFLDDKAWLLFSNKRTLLDKKVHDFMYPQIDCNKCIFNHGLSASVGSTQYFKDCVGTTRWFEQDLVRSYAVLASHFAHNPTIQVFNIATPDQELLPEQCKTLRSEVLQVISVFLGNLHFSVAVLDVKERCIVVYDGLPLALDTWNISAMALLKRFKLISLDVKDSFAFVRGNKCMRLVLPEGNWFLKNGVPLVDQSNGYDCGPLACLHLMKLLGRLPATTKYKKFDSQKLRSYVINDYQHLIEACKKDLFFLVKERNKEDLSPDVILCGLCHNDITLGQSFQMPCCKDKHVHESCYLQIIQFLPLLWQCSSSYASYWWNFKTIGVPNS